MQFLLVIVIKYLKFAHFQRVY